MATQSTCTYSLPFTATVAIDAHSSKAVGRDVKSPPPPQKILSWPPLCCRASGKPEKGSSEGAVGLLRFKVSLRVTLHRDKNNGS